MPKVTKKKKEKNADFSKAKLKLGKGKQLPTNATDTSFKARSIALPGQNPISRALAAQANDGNGQPKSDAALPPMTSRGIVLDEVLITLRHPNGGMRKDTLTSLKEVLVSGVEKGVAMGRREGEVGKVIRALGGLVSDNDGHVRKALLNLLSWYLPLLSPESLSPHLPLLLLQISSGLSHIFPEVRLDACKLVHLLLQYAPSEVVGLWPAVASPSSAPGIASTSKQTLDVSAGGGGTILEGLRLAVGLGAEKGTNTQMGFRLTPGAKLVTLKTMLAFITCALRIRQSEHKEDGYHSGSMDAFDGWTGAVDDKGIQEEPSSTVQVGYIGKALNEEGWVVGSGKWGLEISEDTRWEIGRLANGGETDKDAAGDILANLYIALHPLLLSTFLESAPTAFALSPSASSTEDIPLALCSVSAALTSSLGQAILGRPASSASAKEVRALIADLLRRMATWFPFRTAKIQPTTPTGLPPAVSLSLSYSRIAVLLSPAPVTPVLKRRGTARDLRWSDKVRAIEETWGIMRRESSRMATESAQKGKGKAGADGWALTEVADWVVDTLTPQDALSPAPTPATYSAILPLVWALLKQPPPSSQSKEEAEDTASVVGEALLKHLLRQGASSAIKREGNRFCIEMIRVHEARHPTLPFYLSTSSPIRPLLKTWFEGLPKNLWEIGSKDDGASERLLQFLLETGLRGKGALESPFSILGEESFEIVAARLAPFFHLEHPSKGSIPGPWTKLTNAATKKLGLDVARIWLEWDGDSNLKTAVMSVVAVQSGWVAEYWGRL
ncbi:pre-rRNA-processing protein IPI1, partial [Tremellales sp. Uapishka_1]